MTASALQVIDGGGRAPAGWEALWARDDWRRSELPHGDLGSLLRGNRRIRFGGLAQPWLKEACKRWARARLLSGTSVATMASYVTSVGQFSAWLADVAPAIGGPAQLDRATLERYLLWVRTSGRPRGTQQQWVIALRALLEEQREDGLTGLPAATRILGSEIPRIDDRLPKVLPEAVFEQLLAPANLALLTAEWHRTALLVLAYTGLRVSSLVTLPRDALELGPDGHPYMRYRNIKLQREAIIPIPPRVAEQLQTQERFLCERFPDTDWLLPSASDRHVAVQSVQKMLRSYVRRAGIRDAEGQLARVHPHLFRHHLGTSMVNDGVPLTVIQKVLDHRSLEMTAHYARLHDETLRREVRRWQERVNIRGERIALPIDGPLEEAAWMKERIARARQALPNGYCGLPLVQTCPHPNACLSCENFLTDGSFRPVHEQQLEETRRLLANARAGGQVRLVDVLERDQASLTRILTGLDAIDADTTGSPLDLAAAADRGAG